MKTVITDSPLEAAEFIRRGGIVAFPTETVYGLGADAFNRSAVGKIFEAKQRPADNPLIVHIADRKQIALVAAEISESARRLIDTFFPGPLTIVLKKAERVPFVATAGLNTVGVRMPNSQIARVFLLACDTPVVAPSANVSGRPSPTTWQAVVEDLDGRIDCILKGGSTQIGLESTVIDCSSDPPVLLRPGAISWAQLKAIVPDIGVSKGGQDIARSPGMRHKHYSPRARIAVVTSGVAIDRPESTAYIGLHKRSEDFALIKVCSTLEDYARSVFEFFRECDRREIPTIYCEIVPDEGIGTALLDRLRRAAEQ